MNYAAANGEHIHFRARAERTRDYDASRINSLYSAASVAYSEVSSASQLDDDHDQDFAAIEALQAMIRQKQDTLEKLRKLRETPLD